MSSEDSIDVTLALVDPTLLSSWEGTDYCNAAVHDTNYPLLYIFTLFFSKEEEEVKGEQGEETEGST